MTEPTEDQINLMALSRSASNAGAALFANHFWVDPYDTGVRISFVELQAGGDAQFRGSVFLTNSDAKVFADYLISSLPSPEQAK